MYKVMIIDDEPIIVEGLSRSVAWEKYDCQVVNTAHDGQEGIEKIRKEPRRSRQGRAAVLSATP